jgi:multidrug efflux pump subunit AcrA (membrane-fusion protein)
LSALLRRATVLRIHRARSSSLVALGFGLILSGALAGCSRSGEGKKVDAAAPAKSAQVRIVRVEHREIRRAVESVGSLFAFEEVTVSSEIEGKVDEVLVDVGDRVTAGQPLVRVSPIELRLAVEQQRASLEQARARLGLHDGGEDLTDVRQAAEVKKAAADLNDAEQKYRRGKSLLDQGLLPRENFDETEAKFKSARAAYDLAVQMVQNLRAQVQQYRASLALAEKKLADAVIKAPFGGQVRERTVTAGQYLKVQTPVLVIVNVDPLRVRLKVPEKMAAWIRVGQPVAVAVEAYPDQKFSGKLWRINPAVEQQTRSFDAEALVENKAGLLKPGFFVRASIPSEKVDSALFVPQQALTYAYGVYKVFVVDGTQVSEKEVKVGDRASQEVEVINGLKAGEEIAVPSRGVELHDRSVIEVVP